MSVPIQAPGVSRGIPVSHTSPRREPGDSLYLLPWCGQPSGLKKQLLSSPRAAT